MKRVMIAVGLALSPIMASAEVLDSEAINEPALTYDNTYDYYMDSMVAKRASAVMAYSIATVPTNTFTDGRLATGSITVAVTTTLRSGGDYVSVGGFKFRSGLKNVIGDAAGVYDSFFAVTSTLAGTAANLAYVINRHPGLSDVISAVTSTARIDLTSKLPDGVAYALTSTSGTKLSLSSSTMLGGILSAIDGDEDTFTSDSHGLTTGIGVVYNTSTALGAISGLTNGETYYVIKVDADRYQLAASKSDATAGTAIDISYTPSTTNHSYELSPIVWGTSTASAKWRQSNDGSNFYDIPSISGVSMTSSTVSTVTGWDFEWFNFRWLRLDVTGPATGGINMKVDLNVKQ